MAMEIGRPEIGITIGDAAGIGPEISLRVASDKELAGECAPVLVGDIHHLRSLAKHLSIQADVVPYLERAGAEDVVRVFHAGNLPDVFPQGIDSEITGKASAQCIEAAVDLCKSGTIAAMTTAPISKKAIALAGYDYPGHTEFLAELTGTRDFAMSFFAGKLCVVLLSTHVSLRDAIEQVKTDKLIGLIRFTDVHLTSLLRKRVRLAVAGLNPHASEHGMFGSEEGHQILPAIEFCREELAIDVSGPYSPDTVFLRGHRGEFDAVVACYHDQATIAVKSLSFGSAVNVTLGLPIIRTSVDHGTAYDIAGKGCADPSSLKAAVLLASQLARVRQRPSVRSGPPEA
jgi:4-phospho-D-threonate 3-dehydrogenase / 4-phospho-D-erythronate 3-dehydrogenase